MYETRPKYFIEIGSAWGGGLLFYSSLMEILGGNKVIGVDIYIYLRILKTELGVTDQYLIEFIG